MNFDKILIQIVKDIIKALSIFITQIFSVVTFYQVLFSHLMTDVTFKHIIVVFAILFSIVFCAKALILANDLIIRCKQLGCKNGQKTDDFRENENKK